MQHGNMAHAGAANAVARVFVPRYHATMQRVCMQRCAQHWMKRSEHGRERRNEVGMISRATPAIGDTRVVSSCVPANLKAAGRAEGKHDNGLKRRSLLKQAGKPLPP